MKQMTPPVNKSSHYASLDGLRAYTAIGIVLMHVLSNICVKPSENYLTLTIIPFFSSFVLLFMMISAFSMCCGYYERVKTGMITPNAFYKKRYLRILPFFAFLNIIALLMDWSVETLQEVYANLTLGFSLLPDPDIETIGVGWFLGIIFVFYMLFPFYTFLIDNKRRAWLTLLITLGLLFIAFTRFGNPRASNIVYDMPYFLVGGIIYLYREKCKVLVERNMWLSSIMVVAIIILYFVLRGRVQSVYLRYSMELLLFASILVFGLAEKNVVLSNPIVKYLSGISLEIYLCHMVMFRAVEKLHLENFIDNSNWLYIVTCVCVIVGAIVFSHSSKNYIINPLMKRITK